MPEKDETRIFSFEIPDSAIDVYYTPEDFYEEVLALIRGAKTRCKMITLYVGTGDREREMLRALGRECNAPERTLVMDYLRGTRKDHKTGASSVSLCKKEVLHDHTGEMIRNPAELKFFCSPMYKGAGRVFLRERQNEVLGVQHMKAIVADDTVLLTGANFGGSYFRDRQDRCLVLRSCPDIAEFVSSVIDAVSGASIDVGEARHGQHHDAPKSKETKRILRENFEKVFDKFKDFNGDSPVPEPKNTKRCIVQVGIQCGYLNMHADQELLWRLLEIMEDGDGSRLVMASGYANPPPGIEGMLASRPIDVIVACPKANSFYKSGGLSQHIPDMYTTMEVDLMKRLTRGTLHEYERPYWTFHAKGIWGYRSVGSTPIGCLVGSSNYGYRARDRDLEMSFLFRTKEGSAFSGKLQKEVDNMMEYSSTVPTPSALITARNIPAWVQTFTRKWLKFFL
ncbi:CDP-diacylglycerol--glycerol-3-phosphate 3-phosphatidyltransferase, putative [Perkinsus marinus ATCC 50983]|uniref:CDP-diacylglycerol--glycerol-3-phosphate 3-phosphatidyltransferase n=1 Tax=Perkinsus marinus (strain ATCC 50983 / TXsc) TaxID=423536 RepID=C5K5C8_PERM5|nr:CDP-diacylglycerol--glycerol-3-phosphate 3-phosphatidyltransferase, putative [Perkinsus marinus ATCC 50983]EER20550.1 CDP-diacylglycerol--glycerol-3-phosphate 3-phosphatidyltransferase, putative [Perkinsus marinus ATCC 50983]|eukprot:XP_002788754.1 CDP-diacylglycerol--glycerol-3-phosphate 3-phosphatidyltransferase, putative [Perkinsus marinus ATCC 50983]